MDEMYDPLKCNEDLPSSPGCHMDYDDMPELQAVEEDRRSLGLFQVGAGVSHQETSGSGDTNWLAELANIATSLQSPLLLKDAPHKRSSPVHIFGTSNSLHSYARPPLASSAPSPSRGHLRERRRVRASSESESGVFSMSSSFSDDEDMAWSRAWPSTAWHCFLKGTRLRFHRGPNVEWQEADELGDSDEDSDDDSMMPPSSSSSLKRFGCEGLKLISHEETLSYSQAVLKLTFDPGSPDDGLLTAECRLDHPFFVRSKGWASFYPSLTVVHHGIPCYEMQLGDTCLPPNHPDAIKCDDSVVFDTFRSYDFTPLDSSAVYVLSSMARQRRTCLSGCGAASPDCDKLERSGSPQSAGGRSGRGQAPGAGGGAAPTKCKRPMNAFMLFAKKYRVEYTQMYPGKDNRAISVILGDKWKKMKSEERRLYTTEAKALAEEQKRLNPDCWKRKRTNSDLTPMQNRVDTL
ncbi:HMG box-containing protein 1 isoform X1 [Phycodurus eques]|uniref:HMG box-containing protein 1 isoform X1 n=1 Tax=Phycodurus eques TaxID=693459 RepID=UPI002ACE1E72|nr:HMG box-containing protein 1 isoform X1 [Phycodurus eques]XP_061533089.1 HMG box-containing protein 1 isoform X1 [Phycodurus eques]XP_061533090.1 HMG box-containing protein 1 isoform X1 [Phycodurus eques]XP_061533091.1 HMG box-containing protein 1 isoform X1 [Phycodurus eques]XP_061533092.1 HMG box-containing protein 1 isoform X1 [Phycodurus eques]